jgi:hypothetical protein
MSKWYIKDDTMINLDRYSKITIKQTIGKYRTWYYVIFYEVNDNHEFEHKSDIKYESSENMCLSYRTEKEAKDCFNEVKKILSKNDELSKLRDEVNELREMIKHLPVVGSVYVEAKEEFEANSKIEN